MSFAESVSARKYIMILRIGQERSLSLRLIKCLCELSENILVCMIAGLGLSTCTPSDVSIPGAATIDVMNGFPDGESGYALGVSGCYAGKLGDFLLMAGGCNFPDKPVSEGGIKHYYKGIYIAGWMTLLPCVG